MQITNEIQKWLDTLSDDQKKQYLDRLERNPFLLYIPHPTQKAFHKSNARIRAFFGGNRSGKTRAVVQELLWYATGLHPYRKVAIPNDIWVVSLDFPSSRDVVQPMIRQLLGSGYLKSWHETDRIITLTNGSTISFSGLGMGEIPRNSKTFNRL
jgi:hypothetical protein